MMDKQFAHAHSKLFVRMRHSRTNSRHWSTLFFHAEQLAWSRFANVTFLLGRQSFIVNLDSRRSPFYPSDITPPAFISAIGSHFYALYASVVFSHYALCASAEPFKLAAFCSTCFQASSGVRNSVKEYKASVNASNNKILIIMSGSNPLIMNKQNF